MHERHKISERLRLFRTLAGVTQDELGRATNRSQAAICRLEAGKQSLDCDDLPMFSQALGIKAEFFVSEDVDYNEVFRVD
jgi:transcriptional regulator with XRE-family HTH domain